jgi:hypothetical protein
MTKRVDLQIRQGETWSWTYTYRNSAGAAVDLTGYTARMAVRETYSLSREAYFSTGSDADGGTIALGGAAGTVTLSMTAAQSAALAGDLSTFVFPREMVEKVGPYVDFIYDLEVVSSAGVVTRLLEGTCRVWREVTS